MSVKIVEFQTTLGVETGLSAYFAERAKPAKYGIVPAQPGIHSADITFPTGVASAITVFLDNIHFSDGDLEVVLQALVDQNRAFILSQPKAMVTVASAIPTVIQTTQMVPYENTVVIGSTAVQTTAFRQTGVSLQVGCPEIIDDDGNWSTNNDTYIKLLVSAAVNEEGQKIVVALSDLRAQTGILGQGSNAIEAPEFISRSMATAVWVRNGQILLLGGLYRNTKNKNLATLPWLTQGEDMAMALAQKVIPGARVLGNPISAGLGNRSVNEGRRELVFLIKAELWRPAFTVATGLGEEQGANEPEKKKRSLIEDISEIPQGLVKGLTGQEAEDTGVQSNLGGQE